MSIVIAHPVFFLLSCRLFVSLADDMKWKYSLSSTTNSTLSAVWHLKNATGSWNHSWAPTDWLAHRLPLNFHCLRSCLRRDRWCLCRWMNTLLCALPFGLNISVSNVTNQMFVSCYVQLLCMLLGDLCIWIPVGVNVHSHKVWTTCTASDCDILREFTLNIGMQAWWCFQLYFMYTSNHSSCMLEKNTGWALLYLGAWMRTGELAAGSCEPIPIISLLSHIC